LSIASALPRFSEISCLSAALQALDGAAILEVLGDDLRDIGGRHVRVPDALGVDDQVRAVLAHPQRAAGGDRDGAEEVARGDLAAQGVDDRLGAVRGAARKTLGLALVASEDVVAERMHDGPRGMGGPGA
jgi:hypothetical protein